MWQEEGEGPLDSCSLKIKHDGSFVLPWVSMTVRTKPRSESIHQLILGNIGSDSCATVQRQQVHPRSSNVDALSGSLGRERCLLVLGWQQLSRSNHMDSVLIASTLQPPLPWALCFWGVVRHETRGESDSCRGERAFANVGHKGTFPLPSQPMNASSTWAKVLKRAQADRILSSAGLCSGHTYRRASAGFATVGASRISIGLCLPGTPESVSLQYTYT
jgi:hypothetical protein